MKDEIVEVIDLVDFMNEHRGSSWFEYHFDFLLGLLVGSIIAMAWTGFLCTTYQY